MTLGDLILRCQDDQFETKQGVVEQPFVVKRPDEKLLEELSNASILGKFASFINATDK